MRRIKALLLSVYNLAFVEKWLTIIVQHMLCLLVVNFEETSSSFVTEYLSLIYWKAMRAPVSVSSHVTDLQTEVQCLKDELIKVKAENCQLSAALRGLTGIILFFVGL
jgi:hypothetical protein